MRISLVFFVCLLAACSKTSERHWMVGDWDFDAEYTMQKQAEKPPQEGLAGGVKSMVKDQLTEKMQGAKLKFTATEFTMTTKDGNGGSHRGHRGHGELIRGRKRVCDLGVCSGGL